MVFGAVGETLELLWVVVMVVIGIGALMLIQTRSQQP